MGLKREGAGIGGGGAGAAGVCEGGVKGGARTAIQFDTAARVDTSLLGVDIDNPFIAITDLSGHEPGKQVDTLHEARTHDFAEAAHRFGDEDTVDAVLDAAAILAVNVDLFLPLPIGVLADAGSLEQDLPEPGARAL